MTNLYMTPNVEEPPMFGTCDPLMVIFYLYESSGEQYIKIVDTTLADEFVNIDIPRSWFRTFRNESTIIYDRLAGLETLLLYLITAADYVSALGAVRSILSDYSPPESLTPLKTYLTVCTEAKYNGSITIPQRSPS